MFFIPEVRFVLYREEMTGFTFFPSFRFQNGELKVEQFTLFFSFQATKHIFFLKLECLLFFLSKHHSSQSSVQPSLFTYHSLSL